MSRTEPRGALNLSTSSISLSEASEFSEQDDNVSVDDIKIERILSEETRKYEVLDALPATPQRPTTRSQARASVSPAISTLSSPGQNRIIGGRNPQRKLKKSLAKLSSDGGGSGTGESKKSARNKRTEKDICKDLGIDLDDSELDEIERDDDEGRIHVDNVIEDLVDLGLGKKKAPGKVKETTVEEEKLSRQLHKLRSKAPLEINGDGRCTVLKDDILTVKKTLEKVNALISALEKTRDKLVNEDKNLVYTAPPVRTKKKPGHPPSGS